MTINRNAFDAVGNLGVDHKEYVLRYALVAQRRAPEAAPGYKLGYTQRGGWRLELNGVVMTQGDAARVYDVARRTRVNEHFRRGFDLREAAHAYRSAS
jgi:hypothetical protein